MDHATHTASSDAKRQLRRKAATPLLAMAGLLALPAVAAHATTLYYNVPGTGSFNDPNSWTSDINGTTQATVPGLTDTAVIGTTNVAGAPVINLDASQSVNTLQIGNGTTTTGVIVIQSDSADTTAGGPNAITIGAGGITHSNNTSGADTIKANVVLGAGQTWTDNVNLNIAGAITGTGDLTLVGNTTFSGNNGFNGNLVLTSGTFSSNNAGFNPGGTGSISFNGVTFGQNGGDITSAKTINFTTGNTNWYMNQHNVTLTGSVNGPGTVTFIPNGANAETVTLGGTTNNASLNVSAGTNLILALNKTSSAGVHAIGGTLTLNANGDMVQLTGTGGDQIADTSAVYLNNGTFDLYGHNETIGSLNAGYYPPQTELVTNSQATSAVLTIGGGNAGGTFQGMIADGAGQAGIAKIGAGTAVLSGASTYTGQTGVYGGTLTLDFTLGGAPTANIAGATSTLVLGGGTLKINASSSANSQSFGATSVAAGASALTAVSNSGSIAVSLGAISRATGGTVNFTLPTSGSIASSSTLTSTILGGYAVVGGANWATISGGSIVAYAGYTNGFSSGADVEAGNQTSAIGAMSVNSIRFNNAGAASVTESGPLTVASGGLLDTTSVGANGVALSGGTITTGNGQDLIVNQYNTNAPMTIGSAIVDGPTGSTGLTKSGGGSLTVGGVNTYTGATNINAGLVTVNNTSNLGVGSAVVMRGTGSLNFANIGGQLNLPQIGATATGSPNTTQSASLAIDYAGGSPNTGTRWETGQSDPGWIYVNLQSVYNLASTQINWETADAKDFVLEVATAPSGSPDGVSGDNGWTVVNTIHNQISQQHLTLTYTLGASAQYVAMYGIDRATPYGYSIWDMDFFTSAGTVTQTIGSLSSADSTTTVILDAGLTLNTGSDNSSTTFAGVISGAGSLVKAGTGTFAVTNANTYTGGTTISTGTLAVNNTSGSATGSGGVTVANGGRLAGGNGAGDGGSIVSGHYAGSSKGIISGTVEVASGGHLTPGNSAVGTMTVGGLTLDSGSVVDLEFNGATNDFIVVTGSGGLAINGGGINVYQEGTSSAYTTNGTYHLIDSSASTLTASSYANLSVLNLGATVYSFGISSDGGSGSYLDLTIGAVPEPGSLSLIGGVGGLLTLRRRRRASKSV